MASIDEIKNLRQMTGAGVNAIREALAASNGNMDEALSYLRKKGMAKSEKRSEKEANNGVLGIYVHPNRQVVVVVEVALETDFAAKSDDVRKFADDMALQVAAANPTFISPDSIDEEALKAEKETYEKDLEGKPEEVKAKILEGKMEKFYQERVLLKQKLFVDDSKTVEDYINELVAKVGEKVEIKHFSKFEATKSPVTCTL